MHGTSLANTSPGKIKVKDQRSKIKMKTLESKPMNKSLVAKINNQ
jgi:hypothetical protein